ncbi:hypothetical protein MAPG_03780 [Magnaporthiopsis poae ATCC 64411]|uniref:Uncharacterized protein n=1 Tax=Magnaporthiopsis poae (strain ATCC 64411 / 73-15) TaxID=644358 RepID=A0A0C4DUY2_MAGP6|nr:hypothetical protein MAPG_03780 [Magnaporthiopsis poae ATCC 64411]
MSPPWAEQLQAVLNARKVVFVQSETQGAARVVGEINNESARNGANSHRPDLGVTSGVISRTPPKQHVFTLMKVDIVFLTHVVGLGKEGSMHWKSRDVTLEPRAQLGPSIPPFHELAQASNPWKPTASFHRWLGGGRESNAGLGHHLPFRVGRCPADGSWQMCQKSVRHRATWRRKEYGRNARLRPCLRPRVPHAILVDHSPPPPHEELTAPAASFLVLLFPKQYSPYAPQEHPLGIGWTVCTGEAIGGLADGSTAPDSHSGTSALRLAHPDPGNEHELGETMIDWALVIRYAVAWRDPGNRPGSQLGSQLGKEPGRDTQTSISSRRHLDAKSDGANAT